MNRGGLNTAQLQAFADSLSAPAQTRPTHVRLLDLSGNYIDSIKPRVDSGQVNVDADASGPTRSATLEFDDPTRSIQFDADGPTTQMVYFGRQVQIVEGFHVPGLDHLHEVPVFTGPMNKLDRTADVVQVEAQGRESLFMHGRPTMTLKRGHNVIDAIRTFLGDGYGETRFAFPTTNHRLPHNVVVSWEQDHWGWPVCQRLADSIGLQLFFPGTGICTLRDKPTQRAFTFKTGDGSNITSQVQTSHDSTNLVNRVRVTGSNKHHVYETSLDQVAPGHLFAPYTLRVNGVRQFYRKEISAPHLRSRSAAKKRAIEELNHAALMQFGVTFNALPVPHLDELDMVRIQSDEYTSVQRIRQWSYALGGGEMTVGSNKLVSLPRRKNKP